MNKNDLIRLDKNLYQVKKSINSITDANETINKLRKSNYFIAKWKNETKIGKCWDDDLSEINERLNNYILADLKKLMNKTEIFIEKIENEQKYE